jgi:hypothetical protein
MTTPQSSSYGNAKDWATIIEGAGSGASSAMQGYSQYANSKEEAKEAKRRTLANLLGQSMKRKRGLFNAGQEHATEMNDYQSHAMQQVAQGFIQSLMGSTGEM